MKIMSIPPQGLSLCGSDFTGPNKLTPAFLLFYIVGMSLNKSTSQTQFLTFGWEEKNTKFIVLEHL